MKRRDFIKSTSFTVLVAGVLPSTTLFANGNLNYTNIPINAQSHIRHGLLAPLDPNLLEKFQIVFQLNEFKDGLNLNRGNDDIKVLSVLNGQSKLENIQLCFINKKATLLIDDELEEFDLEIGKLKTVALSENNELFLFLGDTKNTLELNRKGTHYTMCYSGSAWVNKQKVSTETGLELVDNNLRIIINENKTLLVAVSLNSNK